MGANIESLSGRIKAALRDANQDSWPDEVICSAIYEAENVITNFRPDATSVNGTLTCFAGVEQDLAQMKPERKFTQLGLNLFSASGIDWGKKLSVSTGDVVVSSGTDICSGAIPVTAGKYYSIRGNLPGDGNDVVGFFNSANNTLPTKHDLTMQVGSSGPAVYTAGGFGTVLQSGNGVTSEPIITSGTFSISLRMESTYTGANLKIMCAQVGCFEIGRSTASYPAGSTTAGYLYAKYGSVVLLSTQLTASGAPAIINLEVSSAGGKLFFNGTQVAISATDATAAGCTYTNPLNIGRRGVGDGDWSGDLWEVAAFSTVRHAVSFSDLELTGAASGLIGLWKLNGNGNDSILQAIPAISKAVLESEFGGYTFQVPTGITHCRISTVGNIATQTLAGALSFYEILIAYSAPAGRVLDLKYNINADGSPGRGIRRVAGGDVDAIAPMWRSAEPSAETREFIHDPREPLIVYLRPPAIEGSKIRISYSAIPAVYPTVILPDTETTVSKTYDPAIIEWSLYRLFGHDAEGSVNINRSQQHLNNFNSMMGTKIKGEEFYGPKNLEFKR